VQGQGTTFQLRLPLEDVRVDSPKLAQEQNIPEPLNS